MKNINALLTFVLLGLLSTALSAQSIDVNVETLISDDNTLIITYVLPPLPEGKVYERVDVVAVIENINHSPDKDFVAGDFGKDISPGKYKRIEWDITKQFPVEQLEEFNIEVIVYEGQKSYTGISEIDPFTNTDKIPHYLGAVIGLGMAGTGGYMLLEQSSLNDDLLEHPQASDIFWDDYEGGRAGAIEDKKQFGTVGAVAIGCGVGVLVVDYLIYRRRQKLSKEFKNLTSFHPIIYPEGVGLGFTLKF